MPTKLIAVIFILLLKKFQIPISKLQAKFSRLENEKFQVPIPKHQGKFQPKQIKKRRHHEPLDFEMIDEKISVSSRASAANTSRGAALALLRPVSISRRKSLLSFASFRQIFTRIRKSFLLKASSASIQFAATDPDARTSCLTSSVLLTVLGNCFTNVRTDSANRNVRSSRSRGFAPSSIFLELGVDRLFGLWNLGSGTCGFHREVTWFGAIIHFALGFEPLLGIWFLGFGTCGFHRLPRRVGQIVRRDQRQATFFQ